MRSLLIGACLAIASPAFAESLEGRVVEPVVKPATLRIGKPDFGARIERMALSMWVKEAEIVVALGLDIAGSDTTQRDVTIPLALPDGSQATAMEVAIDGTRTTAFPLASSEARAFYKTTVARMVDPALLERRGDNFQLRVFPIRKQGKQHVDITLTMPRIKNLIVEPRGHVIGRLEIKAEGRTTTTATFRNLSTTKSIALPDTSRGVFEDLPVRRSVDLSTSLVAGRSNIDTPLVRHSFNVANSGWRGPRTVDKTILRTPIKLARPRLSYCYERELLRDASLAGTVLVSFLVSRTGKVEVKQVSGTLVDETVRSCIVDVFASLEYPETDGDTLVNYPLTFHAVDH